MEDISERDEKQVVATGEKPEPTSVVFNKSKSKAKFEPVNETLTEPVIVKPFVSARIQETIDSAGKGWKIKVKSKSDYDAVVAALKVANPKSLTAVHKPGLGHHSIAAQ
tara:strand:+ start:311 stop:637 length:327 start_codon:yes stop_codon:yes gene_type:complete